jgi:hypothetical protein
MSNNVKRISQLGVTTTLATTDRVVVLTNPNTTPNTQTITVNNFINATINNFPVANSSHLGVAKVDGTTIVASANGVLSANTLNFNQIGTSNAHIYGNANTGIDAIYAGIPSGYSTVVNPVIQASVNVNDYAQINFQNISNGNMVSSDYCATASNGDDAHQFVDMGIAGAGWDGSQSFSLGDAVGPGDGYLYTYGGYGGGHLILGAATANQWVKIVSGGPNNQFVTAEFYPPNTESYNTGLGSLVVHGGIGANGQISATGVRVTNSFILEGSSGTAGQIISTDGTNAQWINNPANTGLITFSNNVITTSNDDIIIAAPNGKGITIASNDYAQLVYTGGGDPYGNGDVQTYVYASPNYAGIYAQSNSSVNAEWDFYANGQMIIPGPIVAAATTQTYTDTMVEIDLTKSINILTPHDNSDNPHFHLADGTEGQIMHLVAGGAFNGNYTTIRFAHCRYSNASGASPNDIYEYANNGWWLPFNNNNAVATIIFTDGYWNLPHNIFD